MEANQISTSKLLNYTVQSSSSINYTTTESSSCSESFPNIMENGIIIQYEMPMFVSEVIKKEPIQEG